MCSNRTRRLAFLVGAFAFLLPLVTGCGAGKGNISGEVTLDGKPLPAGTITFYPAKKALGNPVPAPITDGKYSVQGVPVGNTRVTVETSSIKSQAEALLRESSSSGMAMSMGGRTGAMPQKAKEMMEKEKKGAAEANRKGKEMIEKYRAIPEKYEKKESSGLSVEVKKGDNPYNVPLTSQ